VLILDLIFVFYFAIPPFSAFVDLVLLLTCFSIGFYVWVARVVYLLELSATSFDNWLRPLTGSLVTSDFHRLFGSLISVRIWVCGRILVALNHHVHTLPPHRRLVFLLFLLVFTIRFYQAKIRALNLAQEHGVGYLVVDGVVNRLSGLDIAQVLVSMCPRLQLDDLPCRVFDLQVVHDCLPLGPVTRLELDQLCFGLL